MDDNLSWPEMILIFTGNTLRILELREKTGKNFRGEGGWGKGGNEIVRAAKNNKILIS